MNKTRNEVAIETMELLDKKGLIYKRLKKYPLYRIYEDGTIIKDKSNTQRNDCKVLKHTMSKKGYHIVYIYDNNMKGSSQRVHRLVGFAFLDGFSDTNNIINHIDGNKNNNHFNNLEWCSIIDNNKHAIEELGVKRYGSHNGSSKLKEEQVLEIRKKAKNGETSTEVAKCYNINRCTVNRIISRKTWKHI